MESKVKNIVLSKGQLSKQALNSRPYDETKGLFIIPLHIHLTDIFECQFTEKIIKRTFKNLKSILNPNDTISRFDYATMFLSNLITNFVHELESIPYSKGDRYYTVIKIEVPDNITFRIADEKVEKVPTYIKVSTSFSKDKPRTLITYHNKDGSEIAEYTKSLNSSLKKGKNYRKLMGILLKEIDFS